MGQYLSVSPSPIAEKRRRETNKRGEKCIQQPIFVVKNKTTGGSGSIFISTNNYYANN
jgi:hypothetical protein